jgi:hypothetical protein
MSRYRVQLYNVPDRHRYDGPLLRAWRANWRLKLAGMCVVLGGYLLVFVR